jgi:hypothetical protein
MVFALGGSTQVAPANAKKSSAGFIVHDFMATT